MDSNQENDNRTCWWREAIVYQIWPKSFFSGRGTSTGDIIGIISKLDYIKSLGVNTIWLSPHYPSPMIDEGYDISDYENVNPLFGTLQDAERLIKECHQRDLKILFDLVVTYTSDQHEWFKDSRSSANNPKRDWYIWRPAKYDSNGNRQPPTNWASAFHESAWTWDEITQEYYLHLYSVQQPDLNWKNEECRKAIYDSAIKFWLDKGLDGFRVDTCDSKPEGKFKDAPIIEQNNRFQKVSYLITNGPQIHNYHKEMGKIFANYDSMTIGELKLIEKEKVLNYIDFQQKQLSMVFQFDVVAIGIKKGSRFEIEPWTIAQLAKETKKLQSFIQLNGAWTTTFLENHDLGRSVSRFGDFSTPENHLNSCKMLCLYTILQSGTPFIYQGQEIGMTNVPLDWNEKEYLDINSINFFKSLRENGKSDEEIKQNYMKKINLLARDNARTPIQWNDGPNAGFTKEGIIPWMRTNENYKQINIESQLDDEESILSFWKRVISLRKQYPSLFVYGKFSLLLNYDDEITSQDQKVLAFAKDLNEIYSSSNKNENHQFTRAIILLNFSNQIQNFPLNGLENAKVAISSYFVKQSNSPLLPFEGRCLLLQHFASLSSPIAIFLGRSFDQFIHHQNVSSFSTSSQQSLNKTRLN